MAEVGRRQAHALAPLLVLVSLVLLALLAFNLRNLDPGAETLPPPLPEEPPVVGAQSGTVSLQWLYLGMMVTMALVIVVGSILLHRRGQSVTRLFTVWELLGYALATAFLVVAFLFYNNLRAGLDAFARWVTGSRDAGVGGGTGTPPSLPIGSPSSILLIVAVIIVTVYVIVFALAFFPKVYEAITYQAPDVGRSKKELARAVRTAIADLRAGGDLRSAVLACYKSMVLLFETRGLAADPSQTAREFEQGALATLGVSREGVDDLTSLFEEARYSHHPIGEGQRDAAIDCLTSIRRELEAAA